MKNQEQLNKYFSTIWRATQAGSNDYKYTGDYLITKINDGERVIDIGCGLNPYRGRIPNLIGIDPAFPEADFQLSLEDYAKQNNVIRFDVAFCLGSINFGSVEDIEYQISLIVQLLKTKHSRIYWRCNPGRKDHKNVECQEIDFYPWSFDEHHRLAEKFGFIVSELEWDSNNRIYAEWTK